MDSPDRVTTAQQSMTAQPTTQAKPASEIQSKTLLADTITALTQGDPQPEAGQDEPEADNPIVDQLCAGDPDFRRQMRQADARIARVLITAEGKYVVVAPGTPIPDAARRERIECLCEVDMGRHVTCIQHELPSKGDAFRFRASIEVHWRVTDPMRVVADGLVDVRAAMTPLLLMPLRRITRGHRIENCEEAEFAANQELARLAIGPEIGLETRTYVWLSMDEAVRDRIQLAERVGSYRNIIADGDLSQFALRLAQNPDDVAEVVQALVVERDAHRRDMVDLIVNLIRSGAIDRWEIDDQVRSVLQWLQQTTNKVITGTDEARQFSTRGPAEPSNNSMEATSRA